MHTIPTEDLRLLSLLVIDAAKGLPVAQSPWLSAITANVADAREVEARRMGFKSYADAEKTEARRLGFRSVAEAELRGALLP
jgi:hypothetical protein